MAVGELVTRRHVLFMVEAVTLAHVARAQVLAGCLDRRLFDVSIACDQRYGFLFADTPFRHIDLHSISSAAFAGALQRGSPVYSYETLLQYAAEDLRVIAAVDPDVVVGDFRLSLSASARVAGKPYVNVTNAGWSPYARTRFLVPDIGLTRVVGPLLAQALFTLARPLSFAIHALPLNRLRERYALPPLAYDLREAYCDGDITLYADDATLIETVDAPPSHRYLGPVLWSPSIDSPDWASRIDPEKPVVYVALGSSGRHSVLPVLLDALATAGDWTIVVATGGAVIAPASKLIFSANFLDGGEWATRSSLVVCNGGSPTCYQALTCGTPVLGIPSNLDQYINMRAVEDYGAGLLLRSGMVRTKRVQAFARRLIEEPGFTQAARALAASAAKYDQAALFERACNDAGR